jgi:pimeloyl-ACP methyl ester carboxylesterase
MSTALLRCTLAVLLVLAALPGSSAEEPRPPGHLFDVGGYRLHLHDTGKGRPAVVLLSGMGDGSWVWSLVQPEVARFSRVCAYDRAGEGWSDLGPVPRTLRQESHELRLVLRKAGVPPPYVLVGASYGGLIARRFASDYPGEVGGIVLVDSTHEDTVLQHGHMVDGKFQARLVRIREAGSGRRVPGVQTLQSSPPKPPTEQDRRAFEQFMKEVGPPKIEPPHDRMPRWAQEAQLWFRAHAKLSGRSESYMSEEFAELYEARKKQPHPLGSMPLISLRAGQMEAFTPEVPLLEAFKMTPEQWRREAQERAADLARLSTNSRWYVAKDAGHQIHLYDPKLVAFAIRQVVDAVRTQTPLQRIRRSQEERPALSRPGSRCTSRSTGRTSPAPAGWYCSSAPPRPDRGRTCRHPARWSDGRPGVIARPRLASGAVECEWPSRRAAPPRS